MWQKVIYQDMEEESIKIKRHGLESQKKSPPFNGLAALENESIELVKLFNAEQ